MILHVLTAMALLVLAAGGLLVLAAATPLVLAVTVPLVLAAAGPLAPAGLLPPALAAAAPAFLTAVTILVLAMAPLLVLAAAALLALAAAVPIMVAAPLLRRFGLRRGEAPDPEAVARALGAPDGLFPYAVRQPDRQKRQRDASITRALLGPVIRARRERAERTTQCAVDARGGGACHCALDVAEEDDARLGCRAVDDLVDVGVVK